MQALSFVSPDCRGNAVVFGAAGHGAIVARILELTGWNVLGFVDERKTVGTSCGQWQVVAQSITTELVQQYQLSGVAPGIGDNWQRERIVRQILASKLLPLITGIHPNAYVAPSAQVGPGAVVFAGAVVQENARVGMAAIVNTCASLDHDSVLEDFASLLPGVHVAGNCHIGHGSAICIGAQVSNGLRIGTRTVIGGLSLVLHDLPDMVLACGIPARIIRQREPSERYA